MRITCFSDVHGQQGKKLTKWFQENPADVLIYAGDCQLNSFDDGEKFLRWLDSLPFTHKLMIFGNHDGNYHEMLEAVGKFKSVKILYDEGFTIDGVKFYGSPWAVQFLDWFFMRPDYELAEIWKKIPDDVNVLITHTPVYGINDETTDGFTTGSFTLLKRIKELKKLKYHICGHIHEGYGTTIKHGKTFINASLLDASYRLVNTPITIEYK